MLPLNMRLGFDCDNPQREHGGLTNAGHVDLRTHLRKTGVARGIEVAVCREDTSTSSVTNVDTDLHIINNA